MSSQEQKLLELMRQLQKAERENKIDTWKPIPKHHEFLECKLHKKGICAGNRTGKTKTTLFELAMHVTGLYPSWWKGRKFNRAVRVWLVGMSFPSLRDTIQLDLLGEYNKWGTGFIPAKTLKQKPLMKSGVPNTVDTIYVDHVSGDTSWIKLWSSDQKRSDFQAAEIDILLFDEEPPPDIHAECIMRLATSMAKGEALVMYSFTPLSGQTDIWRSLHSDPDSKVFSISMDDVPWLDEKTINSMLHGLSDMEKRARRHGIPAVGSGQIYQFEEEQYLCDSFELPSYWPRIGGLDIGKNHPTGAVALAWDRNSDCIYVYREYKHKAQSPEEVARALRSWNLRWATSHDAFNDNFAGNVSKVFRQEGLDIFSAGRDPWARIEKARTMISQGKLWIFKDRCPELVKEMRTYHTKEDGVTIFKVGEDVIDAFQHAVQFHHKATCGGASHRQSIPAITKWTPSSDGIY